MTLPYEKHYEVSKVSIGDLQLDCGDILSNVEVAYEHVGNLEGEVIIVCHALSGNHLSVGSEKKPGWWSGFIGENLYIDTNEFQIITMNVIGGCAGSTGPTSINLTTGEKFRATFPKITIRDIVRSQYKALQRLGVYKVKAIVGGSLGGMQVLEWGILYPYFAEKLVPMAVTPFFSDYAIAYNQIAQKTIKLDPAWKNGEYEEEERLQGLEIARMVGLVTYRSDVLFNERFRREKKENTQFQVDSYLSYQGKKFTSRFDANSYLRLLEVMNEFDIGEGRNGWKNALKEIKSEVCFVAFTNDLLYTSSVIEEAVNEVEKGQYTLVQTTFGHDGFLVEFEKWAEKIKEFVIERCYKA
ncbi:homoserine O-acetyltransferase MetX [Bacillus sp. FJAT-45066]|uniref:homoserine O-acetyltransferase MetX n=1 Tax=Bacillus sp. FJAT-45066 TaxID=2011010 RepID=UPI000BB8C654|nr:homoserine O-acetyltransferase [Bacillus sp. FJAT-45066]